MQQTDTKILNMCVTESEIQPVTDRADRQIHTHTHTHDQAEQDRRVLEHRNYFFTTQGVLRQGVPETQTHSRQKQM